MITINTIRPVRFTAFLLLSLFAVACGDPAPADDDDDESTSEIADPICDALLTPADFQAVCGSELTLTPTFAEGLEGNPCNRKSDGGEARMLVTRHPSAFVAEQAEGVAGGRGPNYQEGLELHASAGAEGIFMIEIKAPADAGAVCTPDKLPLLLDIALSRVMPEEP